MVETQAPRSSGWLRLVDAARLAGVSRATVARAATRGEIAYAASVHGRVFTAEAVRAWAEWRRGGGDA